MGSGDVVITYTYASVEPVLAHLVWRKSVDEILERPSAYCSVVSKGSKASDCEHTGLSMRIRYTSTILRCGPTSSDRQIRTLNDGCNCS